MQKRYLLIIIIVLIAGAFWFIFQNSFNKEIIKKNPTLTSNTTLTPEQPPAQIDNLITVESPLPGSVVGSPLVIKGQARGNWYFEASFPVELLGANNQVLAQGVAQAQGDWMTENYVPFVVTLNYSSTETSGRLVLKKDNPSGDPSHDRSLVIPLTLK